MLPVGWKIGQVFACPVWQSINISQPYGWRRMKNCGGFVAGELVN